MALLVVNLDQYTSIGEQFGREAKDQALLAMADALKSHMRPQDKLARWHEGQFILLPLNQPRQGVAAGGKAAPPHQPHQL